MNKEAIKYFNSNRLIPFCTHKDIMVLDKKYIEALAFITFMASNTDFKSIAEISGFEGYGEIEDNNLYSYKVKKRSEIHISNCAKYFGKSRNTITNYLNYLDTIDGINDILNIEYVEGDTIYKINHKAINERYYTLINTDTLEKLIQINGTAIKLYLVIKYHYEDCKKENKKCELSMEYLAINIGLTSASQVSKTLNKMDNVFIKRKLKYKVGTKDLNKKNTLKSIYEYEII